MNWATGFGIAALGVCGVSLASRGPALQKLALILFGSWVVSNFVYGTSTPPRLMTLNTLADLSCMALTGIVLIHSAHKRLLRAIIALYVLMLSCHALGVCAWFIFKVIRFDAYYTALNMLYGAQLLSVGGVGVAMVGHHIMRWWALRRPLGGLGHRP